MPDWTLRKKLLLPLAGLLTQPGLTVCCDSQSALLIVTLLGLLVLSTATGLAPVAQLAPQTFRVWQNKGVEGMILVPQHLCLSAITEVFAWV